MYLFKVFQKIMQDFVLIKEGEGINYVPLQMFKILPMVGYY